MTKLKWNVIAVLLLLTSFASSAQTDSIKTNSDSIQMAILQDYNQKIAEIELQRIADSIKKADLESQLSSLKTTDNLQKEELLNQLKAIEENNKKRIEEKKSRIELLRNTAKGFPVTGVLGDTLFI